MEEDFNSVDNIKKWLYILKQKGDFSCTRLMPFNLYCENCACYCRMVGENGVSNCVLRDIRLK